jgi:hypothetical protein
MMDIVHAFLANLFSPALLFFGLGIAAGLMKSDLRVPEAVSQGLSIYLMMAIGFKGGASLVSAGGLSFTLVLVCGAGLAMSALMPVLSNVILKATTRLDPATRAAVSAHYGSVSIVTFVTATSFLSAAGTPFEGYMVAVLALMEAPAIVTGLIIAGRAVAKPGTPALSGELFANGPILLLVGSFIIGALTGQSGLDTVSGFFVTPFQGILALFLLDMGLAVSRRVDDMKAFSLPLALFGLYMPLIGASIGLGVALLLQLDVGSGGLLAVLGASASYIAVPAAMRLALPEAKTAISLPLSLGITFPFNIVIGIPLYVAAADLLLGGRVG